METNRRDIKPENNRLLAGMVRAILPPHPILPPAAKTMTEQAVIANVAGQLAAMPTHLRWPYRVALGGFNWLALARYGRLFANLPPDQQQLYLRQWAGSSIRLKRDFVRLIRSCTLLQYLDHPIVLAQLEAEQNRGQYENPGERKNYN